MRNSDDNPATVPEAISYLRGFNLWRRGQSADWKLSSRHIGACLDIVLQFAESHATPPKNGRGELARNKQKPHQEKTP